MLFRSLQGGTATLRLPSSTPAGSYDVLARFAGDETVTGSESAPVTVVVEKVTTTTGLSVTRGFLFVPSVAVVTVATNTIGRGHDMATFVRGKNGANIDSDLLDACLVDGQRQGRRRDQLLELEPTQCLERADARLPPGRAAAARGAQHAGDQHVCQ